MKRRSLVLTILVILLLSVATLLSGQTTTATVYGHVTDRSQAVIPGATVKLVNNSKHVVMTASSNTHGEFTFNFVPNGSYTLIVQRHGFQSLTQTDLALTAGQNLRLNLTMPVGQVEQTVTVQAPLVNAVNPEQHNTIGTEQVHQLPMQHSDWTGLLQLTNGVAQANQGVSVNGLPPPGLP